ncbi:MAG: zinc ribbon domain-containing protein [Clostridiaceae bacterium]
MKICNACGAQVAPEGHHCHACGATSFFYVCESCGTKFESYRCPQCGTARDAHEKVCPSCGRRSFEQRCPDCGTSLRNVAPIRAQIPKETYAVHTDETAYPTDEASPKTPVKKRAGCVSVAGMALALIGFWCASDIGFPSLAFLVPGGVLLIAGWAVLKPHNRRAWPLIAGAALLAAGVVIVLLYPSGKAS